MGRAPNPLSGLQTISIAIAMTWTAGFIDLIGYLSLFGLYTANMSGNTVTMAHHAVDLDWYGFARGGWAVAGFVFGLLLGAFIVDAEKRHVLRMRFSPSLALESVLIAAYIFCAVGPGLRVQIPPQPGIKFYFLLALLTTAMGLQNVTIRRVGGMNIYTTFVTGTLVKFGEAAAEYIFWIRDRVSHRGPHRWRRIARLSKRNPHARHAILAATL